MPGKKTEKTKAEDQDVVSQEDDISEGEITAFKINKLWADGREDTVRERLNYWLNYAFWRGAQWVWLPNGYVSDAAIDEIPLAGRKRRERVTNNRIQSNMSNAIARAMKTTLTLEVLAQSADDVAQQGKLKGQSVLRQKALNENWEVIKEKLITAGFLGGTAGLATIWDKEANRYDSNVATGDARLHPLTIEEFIIEPGSESVDDARYWIHKQVLPPAAVQAKYKLEDKPREDGDSGGPFSTKSLSSYSVLGSKKGTQVLTYYEKPNYLRPKGVVAVVVGEDVVHKSAWPYPFKDRLNLSVLTCIVDPNKWTGESPVTQAVSPQRQYNEMATKIHETTHRTVGAKFMMDDRHGELNKQLDDDPETPIKLSPVADAKEPKFLQPPQLAPYVVQQMADLRQEIDDALAVHAISRGEAGTNAPDSGYGLSILAENDATPIGRLLKEVARVFANESTNTLELYAVKVKDTRETVITDLNASRTEKWTGKDLAGQTRAVVPPDTVLPRSEAGMLQMAQELMKMKPDWFQTPTQWFQMASVPGFHDMQAALDDDTTIAEWENGRMGQGEAVEVEEFDDHAKHIQQHNHYRKTPAYRLLSVKQRQIFDLHVQNHQSMAAHEAGVKAAQTAMHPAMGGLPGPGGAAAPLPGLGPDAGPTGLQPSGSEPFVPEVPQGVQ